MSDLLAADEQQHRAPVERRKGWRESLATRRFVALLFVLTATVMTVAMWKSERDSCLRNAGIRRGFNNTVTVQAAFLRTARSRAHSVSVGSGNQTRQQRAEAHDAVVKYTALIAAQQPVKTLDCGGVFPDNQ